MSTKALKTQLLAAIAMVLVASIALGSSTYAWFASNRAVTATDMKVTATTTGSLVITKGSLPDATTTAISVKATDDTSTVTALIPATHDLTNATTTGLVYNNNSGNVSASTGLVETGKSDLTFAEAKNESGKNYYKDYVVYIAANGDKISGQDITAKINVAAVTDKLPGATSIDFYVTSVTSVTTPTVGSDTFGGTLNLAGLNPTTNDSSAKQESVVIKSNVDVPKADGSSAIAVLMRVYIDGALKNSTTTTFVKNISVAEIQDTTLGVEFSAADKT